MCSHMPACVERRIGNPLRAGTTEQDSFFGDRVQGEPSAPRQASLDTRVASAAGGPPAPERPPVSRREGVLHRELGHRPSRRTGHPSGPDGPVPGPPSQGHDGHPVSRGSTGVRPRTVAGLPGLVQRPAARHGPCGREGVCRLVLPHRRRPTHLRNIRSGRRGRQAAPARQTARRGLPGAGPRRPDDDAGPGPLDPGHPPGGGLLGPGPDTGLHRP